MFERVAAERWGKRFRVIAFDLRGHGESTWEPPWTQSVYVADIVETIDSLGLEQPDWVGLSFGGRLLLELIARHPERVHRAAVLEPVIQATTRDALRRATEELSAGEWDSMEAFVESRRFNTGDDIDAELYAATYAGHFDSLPDGRIRRRTCQPAIVSIFGELAVPSPPPQSVTRPTMILYAPASIAVSPAQRAAYEPYVNVFVEVPGHHAVLVSAYEETATAVEEFLLHDTPKASNPSIQER
jgi:lipase